MNLKKHCGQKEILAGPASHLFPTRVANFSQSLYFNKDVSCLVVLPFSDETVVSDRHRVMDVTFHPFTIKENEMSGKDDEKSSGDRLLFLFALFYTCVTVNSIILVRSLSASFSHQLSCHLSIVSCCLCYGYPCETVLVF